MLDGLPDDQLQAREKEGDKLPGSAFNYSDELKITLSYSKGLGGYN